jgi:hypothetical protein
VPALVAGELTLAQLGQGTTTVQGYGEHVLRFTFDLHQPPARDGSLTLVFSHSATAVSALSSLRVDLNGQPLASRRFQAADALRTHWSMPLPADQLQPGANVVLVHVFLGSPEVSCSLPANDSLWAEVFGSSTVDVPASRAAANPDLRLLPYPLVVNGSPNNTALIVSDVTREQGNALELAVLLGAHSTVDTPSMTVVGARQVQPGLLKERTVVLDGLASTNPLVSRVAPYLPLRANPALELTGQATALDASVRESGRVGIAEEFRSPWNATGLAVLFSATQAELLPRVREGAMAGDFGGTVAIVDSRGSAQWFDTVLRSPAAPHQSKRPIKALTVAGIVALLALVAVTTWDRRRRAGSAS